jgi:TolB-like protein/Tfp pilus assembly protein PilF
VEVFGRPADFDPAIDPIVRIEATRLRDKLRDYYSTEGRNDPVRIELPKGSYAPLIELQAASAPTPEAGVTEPPAASEPALHPEESLKQVARPHYWPIRYPAGKAVLAAATGGALLGVFLLWPETSPTPPRPEKASIAVLPFTTIGDDATWNRFAYGVTEDIVADLAQSKDLFVVARNSTEVYRGKAVDVREVGSALGVKYVLEGSIQPSSTHIKVTTQLIDARTGGHVWSSRYHRPVTDLFEVQRDVTEKIAATLAGYQGAVVQAERTLIRRKRPGSLTAYEYYLLGMEAKHGGASGAVTKEGLNEAERLFRLALGIDPQLARAYVGLAYVYEYRMELELGGTYSENLAEIETAARKAIQLDPNDGEAQLVLGHYFVYKGLADQAIEQFARAEALSPSSADVAILIAWFLPSLDQPERASMFADRALQLNPNYPVWYNQGLRFAYFYNRQFEKAVKYTRLVPKPVAADHAYLAASSAMIGDMATAKAAAEDVVRANPDWSVEQYLTDSGGFPDRVAQIFVEAARKAGVAACVPVGRVAAVPNLKNVKSCDEERAKQPG